MELLTCIWIALVCTVGAVLMMLSISLGTLSALEIVKELLM